jgi:hypothetical protein
VEKRAIVGLLPGFARVRASRQIRWSPTLEDI